MELRISNSLHTTQADLLSLWYTTPPQLQFFQTMEKWMKHEMPRLNISFRRENMVHRKTCR